jgi:hypothetical protein
MKLPMDSGEYLIITGAMYLAAALVNMFVYRFAPVEFIQMAWVLVLCIPVVFPVRWLVRGTPFWRIK